MGLKLPLGLILLSFVLMLVEFWEVWKGFWEDFGRLRGRFFDDLPHLNEKRTIVKNIDFHYEKRPFFRIRAFKKLKIPTTNIAKIIAKECF